MEEVTGTELWTTHQYVTNPTGDGSKTRIPSLQVTDENGMVRSVTSNEEKGTVFCHMFFPEKPADSLIPLDAEYPDHVNYSF